MAVTPESLARNNSEDGHQAAVFCWAALPETQAKYPELKLSLFAIPNGGFRDKIEAAKLKATGTKAGVSDMFLAVPRAGWHGFFIELKKYGVHTGREDQLEFIAAMHKQGYCGGVFEGWKAAVIAIEQYLDTQ